MAQYRLSSQVIGRSTGRSAVASAAYRSGQSLADERTGQVHDFSRKTGVLHSEIMAPANAPEWVRDRARLWNAVEIAERRGDAQLAREIQLSLPHELDDPQRLELVRGFIQSQFIDRGMIADFAIHAPGRDSDDRNHHAHIMLTMRELSGEGFGKKARDWNSPELLQTWREQWATQQNQALERYGHPSRVDHRRLEVQGVNREPQQHLGPHAHEMEKRGKQSRIGNENRAIDRANSARASLHLEASIIQLDIERHRRQHAEQTAARVHALEDALRLSEIDLARRFDRQRFELASVHATQYGQHERALQSELAAIDSRNNSTGWRKVLRTITGAASRDRQHAEQMRDTLADIERRKREAVQALKMQQERERLAHKERQGQQVQKLKDDLTRQGEKREKEIMRELQRRKWHEDRERKKDAARQQSGWQNYRRSRELSPEQEAKQLARQLRKRPQDLARENERRSAPQEKQPVKRDFDEARRIEEAARIKADMEKRRVSVPAAPAPAPWGEAPRAIPKKEVEVPAKSLSAAVPKAPVAPQRDFTAKAAPTPQKPPQSPVRAEWTAKATPAQPTPAAPAPVPPQPAPKAPESIRDPWAEMAKADRAAERMRPERDRMKDRDFDRER